MMPSSYGKYCQGCPYMKGAGNGRDSVPLNMEDNSSDVLLVFQAPGIDEWQEKKPICSSNSRSAASRIRNSLERIGKIRADFNITNATQCYPGRSAKGRDLKPLKSARDRCAEWLRRDIQSTNYRKIIVFGSLAKASVEKMGYINDPRFTWLKHPSGGLSNEKLDLALSE